jgi:ABC-type thiamine transport system ATPase subunit
VYAASVAATIGSGGSAFFPFTEGFEIPAGAGIGITQQAVTVATGFDVRLIGYEY